VADGAIAGVAGVAIEKRWSSFEIFYTSIRYGKKALQAVG
jgi:hypothetical protein